MIRAANVGKALPCSATWRRSAEQLAEAEFRIVEAARAVLVESGYAGAGFGAVAARAGLGTEAVSQRFSSKRDLYFAVLHRTEAVVCDRFRAAIEGRATFVDCVNEVLDEGARLCREAPMATRFLAAMSADLSQSPELRTVRHLHWPQQHAFVEELVARGVTSGEVAAVDAPIVVGAVTSMLVGLWQISALVPDTPTLVTEGFKRLISAELLRA